MEATPDTIVPALDWPWWPFVAYCFGLFLQRAWDVRKWVRDRTRDGRAVAWHGYFRHYGLVAWMTMAIAVSFFWVWRAESFRLTALGLELHVPYVPQFAFVMGFFSDGFALHIFKAFRNLKSRALGEAP